jgi:S1-C subfamily serine protease
VQAGSPAQAAGLEPGDVILALDQDTVTGIDDIARVLDGSKIGKRVSVRVLREAGRIETLELVPTERLPER